MTVGIVKAVHFDVRLLLLFFVACLWHAEDRCFSFLNDNRCHREDRIDRGDRMARFDRGGL